MSRSYQKLDGKSASVVATKRQVKGQVVQLMSSHGQVLFPLVKLIEQSEVLVGELIVELGTSLLEAILEISATEVAGPSHQGKRTSSEITRHGRQGGVVSLTDRKVRVDKPRLRRRGGGADAEVEVPAYSAMQNGSALPQSGWSTLASRQAHILATMMRGVTTRNFSQILPEACDAVGIAKSSVSRQFVLASEQDCTNLLSRSLHGKNFPIIYIDGVIFGGHHVLAAMGIDNEGKKHILGLCEGASENATVVTDLLQDMISRGLATGVTSRAGAPWLRVKRLFVIDGSKALRAAVAAVFGVEAAVQRCRVHKMRNVLDHLPKDERDYAKNTMRSAFRLGQEAGKRKLLKLAEHYDKPHPSAASSIREGIDELFTVDRLGVSASLARCLVSTNIIESANSGVRRRTNRVGEWQDGVMVMRWAATAFRETEATFRRISGYTEIDCLIAALENQPTAKAS